MCGYVWIFYALAGENRHNGPTCRGVFTTMRHKINIHKVQIQDHHHPANAKVTAIKNDPGFRARQFAYPGRIAGACVALREARL